MQYLQYSYADLWLEEHLNFLVKKLKAEEIKLIAFAILVHPFLILISSAIALLYHQGLAGISNPGFHGLTQIIYQFTSSAANNGSGFEGMADNTIFWNTSYRNCNVFWKIYINYYAC